MKLGLFLRYNRLRSLYREGVDIFIYLEMVEEIGFQMGSLGPVLQEWAAPVRSCPLGPMETNENWPKNNRVNRA